MHILIALTYYRPHYSGLTIHAEREAIALVNRGHQVTVLTSRFDDGLPAREVKDGVEIIRPKVAFRISKGVIMPAMPWWAWKLVMSADVIHLHAPQLDAALIAMIAKIQKKTVVLTYHCDMHLPRGFVHSLANVASNLANHLTARLADRIVHNTYDYAENSPFLKQYLAKVEPILPPVEVTAVSDADRKAFRAKYRLADDDRLIGMGARLATEKGVEFLAEALPTVLERFPRARVLFMGPYQNIVGEEAYAARLAPLLVKLGNHWTFLGILSPVEMTAFFHECEVTILPSINGTESYGLVQVESMTCGTPVIASDLPGVRVPVQSTGMGMVVPAANPVILAQAIIHVLEIPQAYRGQPEQFLQASTPAAVAEAYERIFILASKTIAARKNAAT